MADDRTGGGPVTRPSDAWRADAECARRYPAEWWFPVGDNNDAKSQTSRAKAVCARCPVTRECTHEALRTGVTDGIWGGLTEGELKALRRKIALLRAEERAGGATLHPERTAA